MLNTTVHQVRVGVGELGEAQSGPGGQDARADGRGRGAARQEDLILKRGP